MSELMSGFEIDLLVHALRRCDIGTTTQRSKARTARAEEKQISDDAWCEASWVFDRGVEALSPPLARQAMRRASLWSPRTSTASR